MEEAGAIPIDNNANWDTKAENNPCQYSGQVIVRPPKTTTNSANFPEEPTSIINENPSWKGTSEETNEMVVEEEESFDMPGSPVPAPSPIETYSESSNTPEQETGNSMDQHVDMRFLAMGDCDKGMRRAFEVFFPNMHMTNCAVHIKRNVVRKFSVGVEKK